MMTKQDYLDRAARLRAVLNLSDAEIAQRVLGVLITAFEAAAAEAPDGVDCPLAH